MSADSVELSRFVADARTVTVLTGAGVSTSSGIPDYRDRDGNWKHAAPVQYRDFVTQPAIRQRYWARSFAGWGRIERAEPNAAHRVLAQMEHAGYVDTLITQNVDGLHQRAGSTRVVDLHGRLDSVACLQCAATLARADWQERLLSANPGWRAVVTALRPDGDAELHAADTATFEVPGCERCGGIVKPAVVFFGETVPTERVAEATAAVARAGALLVVGSSLMVFSGLRFVRQAAEAGKPVAILNRGVTRADSFVPLRIDAECGDALAATLDALRRAGGAALPQ